MTHLRIGLSNSMAHACAFWALYTEVHAWLPSPPCAGLDWEVFKTDGIQIYSSGGTWSCTRE